MCARRRSYFHLAPNESNQSKGAPAECVPSLRCGQPVVLGYGLHRETHYAPEALRSNRRGESVHEAVALCGATASPYPVLLGAFRRGDSQTQAIATLGLQIGRAQRWPIGIWLFGGCLHPPFACAWGVAFAGWRWHRRVPVLRELACRVCSNGAPWRVESFAAHPTNATTQVALRNAKGRRQQGRIFGPPFWATERWVARRAKSGQQNQAAPQAHAKA